MNKIWLLVILAFVIAVFVAGFYHLAKKKNGGEVCFKNNCYQVELARTETERQRGLTRRSRLDSDKGMFFIFKEERIYPFWMKDTLIPLDIIWIDKDGKVVYIYKGAQPCGESECLSIAPPASARYVLELNAGEAEEIGLKEGDMINF